MIASYSIRSRIDKEMKWNTGPQFNTEASYFSIPTQTRFVLDPVRLQI